MADDDGNYEAQARGDRGAYARYLAGMNASMQQKVALTAAHLLGRGKIADMGMGSGKGSHALAALYPTLDVVGVDINPEMVAIAAETYRLPNLSFVVGDIAEPVFEAGSLDGIFDSSVLHHVTTFNGYAYDEAADTLRVQSEQLAVHGVLIVRDFVAPPTGDVWLDVAHDDGDDGDDPSSCSTAALLRRFAREFRSLHARPGFDLREVTPGPDDPPLPAGRRRFALTHRLAVEFVLRKDYRRDWVTEVQEEYTYFDQLRFEAEYAALGLRVLASQPIRNPWIYANRFVGKLALWDPSRDPKAGAGIPLPPTNYVIVGEKVPPGEGVAFAMTEAEPSGYLSVEHHRHRETGQVFDLVRRPHLTVDAIPWFPVGDEVFVLARLSYPRPILLARGELPARNLDDSRSPGWIAEPLTFVADDKPIAQTVEDELQARVGIDPGAIRGFAPGPTTYPSPGGVQEEVRTTLVEIAPMLADPDLPDGSGFSSSGRAGAIEACQLLRAAQVGGLPDARLEIGVHALLRRLGRDAGPWIGAKLEVDDVDANATSLDELQGRARRRRFGRTDESAGFLARHAARFDELDREGRTVASQVLEYVVPTKTSLRTVSVAPLLRIGGVLHLGVDDDDRPAAQCMEGHSDLLVAPAWRLPEEVGDLPSARAFLRDRLRREHGVETGEPLELGGHYHPSPGSTPEVVHPFAAPVRAVVGGGTPLCWVPLAELLGADDLLRDGHLRLAAFRCAHALDVLR